MLFNYQILAFKMFIFPGIQDEMIWNLDLIFMLNTMIAV